MFREAVLLGFAYLLFHVLNACKEQSFIKQVCFEF